MKKGDVVEYIGGQDYEGNELHKLKLGERFTVAVVGNTSFLRDTVSFEEFPDRSFIQSMFKVVNMPEFGVGDIVKIIKNSVGASKIGSETKINSIGTHESAPVWNLPSGTIGAYMDVDRHANDGEGWWQPLTDLKLIKKGNMKKIIGWIAPMDMYQNPTGGFNKGDIVVKYTGGEFNKFSVQGKDAVRYYIPEEYVMTWTPVYEQEEKQLTFGNISITIGKNKIEADAGRFSVSVIESVLNTYFMSNKTIASNNSTYALSVPYVTIGCSQFTKNQLQQIIETYKELNP